MDHADDPEGPRLGRAGVAARLVERIADDDGDLPADRLHEAGDHVDALGPGADVLDEELVEVGVALDEGDVGVDRRLEQFTRPAPARQRRGDLLGEPDGEDGADARHQPVAVTEVAVEDRLGDATRRGELFHRDTCAVLADGVDGRVEEL